MMMNSPFVEPNLSWAWLHEDDLPQLAELREATDYLDDPVERVDLAQLSDLYHAPAAEPSSNAVVGRDSAGSVIAYAWGHPRRGEGELRYWLDWAVHPTWNHRQIGAHCVEWLRERGLAWWHARGRPDPLWMGAHVDEKLVKRVGQMERAGFVAEKWFCDMLISFDEVTPAQLPLVVPEGVSIVPFTPYLSEGVRRAHNRAFATVPGSQRIAPEVWAHTLTITTIRPEWSWVALHRDQVIGYAISSGYATAEPGSAVQYTEGWTEFLGTVPEWRGRGVARAVLTRALRGFAEAGLAGAGLGVDDDQGGAAYRLFADLGYRSTDRLVLLGMRRDKTDQ